MDIDLPKKIIKKSAPKPFQPFPKFIRKATEPEAVFVSPQPVVLEPMAVAVSTAIQEEVDINFLDNAPKIPRDFKMARKEIAGFALATILVFFCLQGARIIASSLNTKVNVLGTTDQALSHLKEAQSLIGQKDFLGAEQQLEFAERNFANARKDVSDLGIFVTSVLKLTPQGNSADHLLSAGESLSKAGIDLNNFYSFLSQINSSPAGFEAPDGFYGTTNAALKYLASANTNLSQALSDLNAVDPETLPVNYQSNFASYKDTLSLASSAAQKSENLLRLFQQFIGSGKKSILVLFENNNELRPTGGFIGTYGMFKMDDGKIIQQKITSIYDIDGQLRENIVPPVPLQDVTQRWSLRDSNWFIDFPKSAEKASRFYEKEAGETPDAVIAVTPDLFVDLLRVTGPLYFPKYNLTLNAENFRDLVQLNTSEIYDRQLNTPKQMLADFAPLLLQKLSESSVNRSDLLAVLFQNLYKKNLIFYDRNPEVEKGFKAYNWAGEIATTDSDYLAVYNTNIAGKKTDLDVKQELSLNSEVQKDGSIVNTLTYTREHQLNLRNADKNIDYARFVVPLGSKLISAEGFTKNHVSIALPADYTKGYKIDPDLPADTGRQMIDGTEIGQESGKTTFANWIEVAPGEKQTVVLRYVLPFKATDKNQYSVVFQKQPGNNPIDLTYHFVQYDGTKKIIWYTPGDVTIGQKQIDFKEELLHDLLVGFVFSK